jgi:hypothetical protein
LRYGALDRFGRMPRSAAERRLFPYDRVPDRSLRERKSLLALAG